MGGDVYCRPVRGHRACRWQIQMGRLSGSSWLDEHLCGLGLSCSPVFPCEGHTFGRGGKFGVLPFSPIHVPLTSSGIFKWTHSRDNNLASWSQTPLSKTSLAQGCELQPSGQPRDTAAMPPSRPTYTRLLHNFPLGAVVRQRLQDKTLGNVAIRRAKGEKKKSFSIICCVTVELATSHGEVWHSSLVTA